MTWTIRFTRQAEKDLRRLTPKMRDKVKQILRNRVAVDPYCGKALVGDLRGYYSLRISYKDRLLYTIRDEQLLVIVIRARTHYGE